MKIKGQAIYGSSVHRVVLEFEGEPSPSISGTVKFYERDQLDMEKSFNSFQRLVEIVKEYWEQKTKTEVFNRRLASWFADYFQNLGYGEVDTYAVLKWIDQGPTAESSVPLPSAEEAKYEEKTSVVEAGPPAKEETILQPSKVESEEVEPIIEEISESELETLPQPEPAVQEQKEPLISAKKEEITKSDDIVEIVTEKVKEESKEEKNPDLVTPTPQKIETSEDMIKAVMEKVSSSNKVSKKKQHRGSKKPRKRQPRKK